MLLFTSHIKDDRVPFVEQFGKYSARELELRATIVHVDRELRAARDVISQKELIGLVKEIKPHFRADEIGQAITELEEGGHVLQRA